MRARLLVALVAALTLAPVLLGQGDDSARLAAAAGSLANPGFEDGALDGNPVAWTVTQPVPDVVRVVDSEGPSEFPAYGDMGGVTVAPYRGDLMLRMGTPRRVAQNQTGGRNGVTQSFVTDDSTLSFALRLFSWEHRNRDELFFNLRQGATTVGTLAAPLVIAPANGPPSTCTALPCDLSIDVGQNGQFLDSGWQVVEITGVPTGVTLTFDFAIGGTNDASHGTWGYLDSTEVVAVPPVAKFRFVPVDALEGSEVQFFDESFDPDGSEIVSWEWVINGEPISGRAPIYLFADEGAYDATLTVTNADGETTTVSDGETALDGTEIPPLVIGNADPLVNALNVEVLAGAEAPLLGRFADPGASDTHTASWTVGGQGIPDTLEEDNLPAYGTGIVTGAVSPGASTSGNLTVQDDDGGSGSDAFTVTVVGSDVERHEPNESVAGPPVLEADGSYLSYIQSPGDVDIFEVKLPGGRALPAGAEVLVTLRDLPADYDVALLSLSASGIAAGDSGQTSFDSSAYARSAYARSAYARSAYARSAYARSAYARSAYARSDFTFDQLPLSEIGFTGINGESVNGTDIGLGELGLETLEAQGVRIAAFSANRGLAHDVVFARTAASGTRLLIAVIGANDEFTTAPYRLQVEASAPIDLETMLGSEVCTGTPLVASPASAPVVLHDFAGTPTTLFVTQRERMQTVFDLDSGEWNALLADLVTLSQHPAVQGEIVSLPGDIYTDWDTHPCSIDAVNALTDDIRAVIQPMMAGVQYVVFVGDDGIVPFRRVPDETTISNERDYAVDALLRPGSPLFASVALGFNLTDDFYVDFDPSAWQGRQLFVPDLPSSRLVETPDEISAQAEAFVASQGILNPSSGFVSGYDFFGDGADAVAGSLSQIAPTTSLINDTWTADDLRCGLLGIGGCTPPTLAAPNAHYTHYGAMSANGFTLELDDVMSSLDVLNATDALTGALVFTIGCHAGLSVPDGDALSDEAAAGIDPALDFAQAMAIQRAVFIASTGFGIGETTGLGGTEQLLAIFAEGLTQGGVPAGQALVAAKQEFVLASAAFTVYEEKSSINTTLYGLPMYTIAQPVASAATAANLQASAITPALDLTITDGASTTTSVVPYTELTLPDGTVISAGGDVQVTPARPLQPRVVVEPADGVPVHGALLMGGAYQDITGFDPVIAQPTTEWIIDQAEPQVCLSSFWPSVLTKITSLTTAGGLEQRLVVLPAHFRCDEGGGAATVRGLERLYSALSFDLLRCDSDDFIPPAVQRVELVGDGATVHATIDATDASGIVRIVALRFSAGLIVATTLNITEGDPGPYELDVPDVGPDDRLVFQVQDGACNVTSATGKGVKLNTLQIEVTGDGQFVPGEPEPFPVTIFGSDYTMPLYYEWDFGDGTLVSGTLHPGDLTPDGLGNVFFTVEHTYADANVAGTAHVTILDADGGVAVDSVGFGCDPNADADSDLLSICVEIAIGTDPLDPDTDGDGCADSEEIGPDPAFGGLRNPLDFWDFYDVTNDQSVALDLSDTLLILGRFGTPYNDGAYVLPGDNLLDRYIPDPSQPWRAAESNDGIDLIDALANLKSFGHSCAAPP